METMMDPIKKRSSWRTLPWLVTSLLLGVAAGIVIIPILFKFLPGDTSRNRTILQTIKTQEKAISNACFLGNSVVMNGINTKTLSQPELTVWNFSSPGQKLLESSLILAQTPANFQTVLIGVSATTLCGKETDIPEQKVSAYVMYGYTLPEYYLELARAVDADNLLAASHNSYLKNITQGRWIVKSGVDMWVRNMLRSDLDLKRSEKDMFYPSPYKSKVSTDALQFLIARHCTPRHVDDSTITRESKLILKYMIEQLKKRNGRLILVILPEHPANKQMTDPEYYIRFQEQLRQLQEELYVEIINSIDLLTREQFIDHVHPDPGGAQLLTSEVAVYLEQEPAPENKNKASRL